MNKAEVVVVDEREGGVWVMLNFGYMFGYVIEIGFGYGEWLYGEVVSVGMCMAADMFFRFGWIDVLFKECMIVLLNKCKILIDVFEKMMV